MNNASKGRCVTVTPRGIGLPIFDCRLSDFNLQAGTSNVVVAAAVVAATDIVAAAVTGGRGTRIATLLPLMTAAATTPARGGNN